MVHCGHYSTAVKAVVRNEECYRVIIGKCSYQRGDYLPNCTPHFNYKITSKANSTYAQIARAHDCRIFLFL